MPLSIHNEQLENLVKIRQLKAEPASKDEIAGVRAITHLPERKRPSDHVTGEALPAPAA